MGLTMTDQYDVVIVGAGPVGLGLAVELGQRNVRCLLVERRTEDHSIPKGQNLTNRTLEHFRAWNCARELRAARTMPAGYPSGGVTAYKSLLGEYWFHSSDGLGRGAAVKDLFSEAPERLPQYRTEGVLRERLAQLPSVTFLRGYSLESMDDQGESVEATIAAGDDRITVRSRYLVGCDGSRSKVRALAGIGSMHDDLGARMVLCVFRSPEFDEIVSRFPPCTMLRVLIPRSDGHWHFFGRVGPDATWFFHAPVAEAELSTEDIEQLLFAAVGRPFALEMQHANFWDLRISIASEYRSGNVFIAGDACHSHPPYGGFGLNSGLEDARNLGWKIAAALQGWGGDDLLDSYTLERRPIFERTAQLIASLIEIDRNFLQRYDPDDDRHAFEAAWPDELRNASSKAFLPHFEGSPVVAGGSARQPGLDGLTTREARAGHHLAPATLSDGRETADLVGADFCLLAFDAHEPARTLADAASRLGMPLRVAEDRFAGDPVAYTHRLVLVRPDGYVAWAGDDTPADAEALLRAVIGQPKRMVDSAFSGPSSLVHGKGGG